MASLIFALIYLIISFFHIAPQITGGKKQSEAALFDVRVNLPY
jgi:hypothetical protein